MQPDLFTPTQPINATPKPAINKNAQKFKILTWLKEGKKVTPMDALNDAGCFRLAARIYDLRQDGHEIDCDKSEGYAVYSMAATS